MTTKVSFFVWHDEPLQQADSVVPDSMQGYDRYAYVNNSPARYTDPTGHRACGEGETVNCNGRLNQPSVVTTGCGNLGQTRCNGNPPSYGDGLIGPPIPSNIPTVQCTPIRPCVSSQTGNTKSSNPTDPDYWSLQGTFIVFAGSVTVDRYGNVYFAPGGGVGSSIINGASGAFVAGWVDDPFDNTVPSEQQMEQFLQGPTITGSGGVLGGGGVTWSPWASSRGDAFASDHFSYEAGAYTPQIGVTGTWGILIFDHH